MIGKGTFAVFFQVRNPGWVKYAKEFEYTLGRIIYWYVDLLSGLLFLDIIVAMPKPSTGNTS